MRFRNITYTLIIIFSIITIVQGNDLEKTSIAQGKKQYREKSQQKTNAIKKYATGITFINANNTYTLMPNVFASKEQTVNNPQPRLQKDESTNKTIISTKNNFDVFVREQKLQELSTTGAKTLQSQPAKDEKLVVFNQKSGALGIVLGGIIVKYRAGIDPLELESRYDIHLENDFAKLNFAYFTPNKLTDIFFINEKLKIDSDVVSSEIEVLEHTAKTQ